MDKDVSLDTCGKKQIVGVEKNNIRPSRCRETLQRRPVLAPVFSPADDLYIGVTRLDRLQNSATFVG